MIFGIDLGTTNSLIGTGDRLLTGLVSSSVDMSTKTQVPRDVISDTVVSSYKTDMSMGTDGKLSIQCSAVILKTLAEMAERRYGEPVEEVVISVPAYFTTSQREAVYEAAKIAGLKVNCLINEPTAAAIYLCKDIKELVVVYDLGGGTFDVSIVDSRLGNYAVIATDGIVLGGDNLDRALADRALKDCSVPIRNRGKQNIKKLCVQMRLAKEQIQKMRQDIYVDMREYDGKVSDFVLTEDIYKEVVYNTFYETFIKTSYLINKYIPASDIKRPKLVLVGGSSSCPYLKDMIREQLDVEVVEDDLQPDLIVAKGVSIYAGMLNEGNVESIVEDVTKRLCIEDSKGTSLTIIDSNTVLPCENTITVANSKDTNILLLKLYQGDSIIAKKNAYIGTLKYDYEREVKADEGFVEVTVNVTRDGIISLSACEPLFGDESRQSIELVAR